MTKQNFTILITIGSLLGLGGLVMIFNSVHFGISSAESWLVNQGGEADTGYYQIIINSYIHSFLVAGGILMGVGLILVAFTLYRMLINKKNESEVHT